MPDLATQLGHLQAHGLAAVGEAFRFGWRAAAFAAVVAFACVVVWQLIREKLQ